MARINGIISEEITKYINSKCMLREYKDPNSADTVRACGDKLEELHYNLIKSGCSKREITIETMARIIAEIRRLEQMMR